MRWRTTGILAAVFAGTLALWATWRPAVEPNRRPSRVFEWLTEAVTKLEVQPVGEATVILERRPDAPGGAAWWLAAPVDRPAWEPYVLDMVGALRRLTTIGAIAPGAPGYDAIQGINDRPQLVVHVHRGAERRTFKFGMPMTKDPSQRWFVVEGDATLYAAPLEAYEPFLKRVAELRHLGVVFIDRHRVWKVELHERYERVDPSGARTEAVDVTEFEWRENRSGQRGWYWTKTNDRTLEERLDDARVNALLEEMAGIHATEFQPLTDPAKYRLDRPSVRYRFHMRDAAEPVGVDFGGTARVQERDVMYVRPEGSQEVAIVEKREIPRRRDDFRSGAVYDFDADEVAKIEVQVNTPALGRVQISRQPDGESQTPGAAKWVVEHPAVKVEKDAVVDYVGTLLSLQIVPKDGFLGMQPRLDLYGLQPPMAEMRVHLRRRDGKEDEAAYRFGHMGDKTYMTKPGSDEVFLVPEVFWRHLEKLELNFRNRTMFNVPRANVTEMLASMRVPGELEDAFFKVTRQADGTWKFTDTAHEGAALDPKEIGDLLDWAAFVPAEELVSRRPEDAREFGLAHEQRPGRLEIFYLKDKVPAVKRLFFSAPRGGASRIHYARFEDDPIIFRLDDKLPRFIAAVAK